MHHKLAPRRMLHDWKAMPMQFTSDYRAIVRSRCWHCEKVVDVVADRFQPELSEECPFKQVKEIMES